MDRIMLKGKFYIAQYPCIILFFLGNIEMQLFVVVTFEGCSDNCCFGGVILVSDYTLVCFIHQGSDLIDCSYGSDLTVFP